MKKKLHFLTSMKLGLGLLVVLVIVCVFGSLIQQGKPDSYYLNIFGTQIGNIILTLGMDDVFHCWWVILIAAFLCLNLICCSIVRFPKLMKQYKYSYIPERFGKVPAFRIETETDSNTVIKHLHLSNPISFEKGYYSVKGRIGIWGSWLCHLSLIMIIVGYGAGQVLSVDTSMYGVVGQTKTVQGTNETLEITIDDFEIQLRDDHTVEQYIATLTINSEKHGVITGESSVNYPLDAFGYRFYQNSTGWANVLSVYRNEELIHQDVLCVGESYTLDDLPLTLLLASFYPDFAVVDGKPVTLTPYLMNPTSVFALYYDQTLIDMNSVEMEQAIQVDDYVFVLHHPQQYTLIQVMYDPTMGFVLLGGIVMLIALFLSFYVNPSEIWIVEESGKTVVYGYAKRGSVLFENSLRESLKRNEGK